MRLSHLFLTASLVILAACASPAPTPTPTPSPTPSPTPAPAFVERPVLLPADDAPHADANTEWWYFNGHLSDATGNRYGFHAAVFRVTVPGFPPVDIGHVAISDAQKGTYTQDQGLTTFAPHVSEEKRFSFNVSDLFLGGGDGSDHLTYAPTPMPSYTFDLSLQSQRPPALHGGTGLVDFGVAGKSYYYSRTRMGVDGTITVDGQERRVSGLAWFDHQWGVFRPQQVGWDWFALHLDDGTDVMLSLLFGPGHQPLYDYGTVVRADGQAVHLTADQLQVKATGEWTSPATGITYPSGWDVAIPSMGVAVTVAPVIAASEFDGRQTTGNVYWEGDVDVTGSHTGVGYVELTGYGSAGLALPVPTPLPAR